MRPFPPPSKSLPYPEGLPITLDVSSVVEIIINNRRSFSQEGIFCYTGNVRKKKRRLSIPILLAFLLSLGVFLFLVLFTDPSSSFSFSQKNVSSQILFFATTFFLLFFLVALLSRSKTQGILIGATVIGYLLLRQYHFTQLLFLILLLSLFVTLELLITRRS